MGVGREEGVEEDDHLGSKAVAECGSYISNAPVSFTRGWGVEGRDVHNVGLIAGGLVNLSV